MFGASLVILALVAMHAFGRASPTPVLRGLAGDGQDPRVTPPMIAAMLLSILGAVLLGATATISWSIFASGALLACAAWMFLSARGAPGLIALLVVLAAAWLAAGENGTAAIVLLLAASASWVMRGLMTPRTIVALLLALCAFDLFLYSTGILAALPIGALDDADLGLHPFAAAHLAGWAIGIGDLTAAALVGGLGLRRPGLSLLVLAIGASACVVWSLTAAAPIPATVPIIAALAAGRPTT